MTLPLGKAFSIAIVTLLSLTATPLFLLRPGTTRLNVLFQCLILRVYQASAGAGAAPGETCRTSQQPCIPVSHSWMTPT